MKAMHLQGSRLGVPRGQRTEPSSQGRYLKGGGSPGASHVSSRGGVLHGLAGTGRAQASVHWSCGQPLLLSWAWQETQSRPGGV